MWRIHPTQSRCENLQSANSLVEEDALPTTFTVWKRSPMAFQGTYGFTVFDDQGKLVFRVDNYTRTSCFSAAGGHGGSILLMDGSGKALMTVKPQPWMLKLENRWMGYKGECSSVESQCTKLFTLRPTTGMIHNSKKCQAHIYMNGNNRIGKETPDFRVDGSFRRRTCTITNASGRMVAKISRKIVNTTVLLSNDVFTLAVEPGISPSLIMSFLLILDHISGKPFVPVLCS